MIIASDAVGAPNSLKAYVTIRTEIYNGVLFLGSTTEHIKAAKQEKIAPANAPIPEHTAALRAKGIAEVNA